jgi:DNA-binding PucR family transcriptional regulator
VTRVLGIGGVARQPSELRRSFDEASTVVAVQARLGLARQAVCFEQLGVYRLLAQPSGSGDLQRFVEQTLGPLLAYERQHRAGWMPFLEELARANFSVKTAARRLELHVNTAKYRAARIQSLLGVDFADPDVRFSVQLALKIEALRSGTADRPGPA